MEKSKVDLFLELAHPNKNGESRWVYTTEFVGKYAELSLGNGLSWGRRNSALRKKYIVEVRKDKTPGNRVDGIRLVGFNNKRHFNQAIRKDIVEVIRQQKCVMLGIRGTSENTSIEVDHKDGRKDDMRVSDIATQRLEDFQPLCKAANDVKRQICKACKASDLRWEATNIKGNPYPFYEGDEHYTEELGCVGCYQYDPVEYRKSMVRRISKEAAEHTSDFIMKKLYPDE